MIFKTVTLLSPYLNNKTTSVERQSPRRRQYGLSHVINLITLFFARGSSKLGNEVHAIWAFIRTTEVVLFIKLGRNEVFVPNNFKFLNKK